MREDDHTARRNLDRRRARRRGDAAAVCGAFDASPGYSRLAALLDRLFGEAIGTAFRAPFVTASGAVAFDTPALILSFSRE